MRLVVDTNVIVSALLKPGSVPSMLLDVIWMRATVLYDARIRDEYERILARPKFKSIDRNRVADFHAHLASHGICLEGDRVAQWNGPMKDNDDRVFIEVALAGRAEAIVTGNIADYPTGLGVQILPPATLFARL